jgi:AraC-like DNA-binding protein
MIQNFVHFTAHAFGSLDWLEFLGCDYEVSPEEPQYIQAVFERLIRIHQGESPGREAELDGLMRLLLVPFLAAMNPKRNAQRIRTLERFREVLDYIDVHLTRKISLAELAGVVHLQPTYFSNLFCKCFGVPPLRYVHQRRIERAQVMLWTQSTPLKEVAARCGYRDVYHFFRVFKQLTGTPPGAFRRQREMPLP